MPALLASIPSPSSAAIHLGPLQLRAYGLMIALGVIAAVWLTGKRLEEKGIGRQEDINAIALWAVPAGIVGARLYHVITDWELFRDDPLKAFRIWEGGLGIWGGIAFGVLVGIWVARRRGIPGLPAIDAAAPALALAQAIGRWGNWWNQELFGGPTTLPWGLEISPENRPPGYEQYATFHPTFLYESLWCLALCGVLLWIDRHRPLRPGRLFLVYVAGYTFGRFWFERLRIDTANVILGLRVNEWVSAFVFLIAVGWLVIDAVRHRGEPRPEPLRAAPAMATAAAASTAVSAATGSPYRNPLDDVEIVSEDDLSAAPAPDTAAVDTPAADTDVPGADVPGTDTAEVDAERDAGEPAASDPAPEAVPDDAAPEAVADETAGEAGHPARPDEPA